MQLLQRVSDCFHRSKKGPQATVDVHCILRDGAFSVTFDQLDSWEILYTVVSGVFEARTFKIYIRF